MSILSKKQKFNLRAMQTKGDTPEEIAKKLEVDELTVLEELEELHLKPNVKETPPPTEFATHQTIPQKPTIKSKTWTPEVVDKLKKMYLEGKTMVQIADELKLTTAVISNKLFDLRKRKEIPLRSSFKKKTAVHKEKEPATSANVTSSEQIKSIESITPTDETVKEKKPIPKAVIRAITQEINRINISKAELYEEIAIYDKQLDELDDYLKEAE